MDPSILLSECQHLEPTFLFPHFGRNSVSFYSLSFTLTQGNFRFLPMALGCVKLKKANGMCL